MSFRCKAGAGFTLAELLIALAILSIISTFTIPKIMSIQSDARNNAIVKEAAASIEQILMSRRARGLVAPDTKMSDLAADLNYVRKDTSASTVVDIPPGYGTTDCATVQYCYVLHNGSIVYGYNSAFNGFVPFDASGTSNAIMFQVDPDGKVTNASSDLGKAV